MHGRGEEEDHLRYVIVTPARNEAAYIEELIKSVVAQSARPMRWVIVSDGSTDGTDEIVRRYAALNPWIRLLRMPERSTRNFAGKVHAINAGLEVVRELPYQALASLDADLSFEPDYFEFLLHKLELDPSLGVVGTPFAEDGRTYDYRFVNIEHVSGACQLFRRECFEAVGGYVPMQGGGIDHVAVLTARMKGWRTRTFTEKTSQHHRRQGSANRGVLRDKYRIGALDYRLGGHPLWELFRATYQLSQRPVLIGGVLIFCGYFLAWVRRAPRPISPDLIRFRQTEQLQRLRQRFLGQPTATD
ncbi:MAG: glycosyltransferase family 2 protein [Steroidobacteraceae bacterium]